MKTPNMHHMRMAFSFCVVLLAAHKIRHSCVYCECDKLVSNEKKKYVNSVGFTFT